jgi:hypothetical protein
MLSLSPDRNSLNVSVSLNRAIPFIARLRRLVANRGYDNQRQIAADIFVIEIIPAQSRTAGLNVKRSISLSDRASCLPLAISKLQTAGISLLGLSASSIEGVRVEPSPALVPDSSSTIRYSADRMLEEIDAAARSNSAAAACRHVELANLYARQLCIGEMRPA